MIVVGLARAPMRRARETVRGCFLAGAGIVPVLCRAHMWPGIDIGIRSRRAETAILRRRAIWRRSVEIAKQEKLVRRARHAADNRFGFDR
ncbi:hypothetical protein [Burkholderia gladioli]|uniref:hypothetical protein n=1 Tax=Burkholderia gladioli TaxID=28095 RepID=UPI0016410980|nr:hypothetical protein [Burkholderia gladioli]